jgi:hypothetical protein
MHGESVNFRVSSIQSSLARFQLALSISPSKMHVDLYFDRFLRAQKDEEIVSASK